MTKSFMLLGVFISSSVVCAENETGIELKVLEVLNKAKGFVHDKNSDYALGINTIESLAIQIARGDIPLERKQESLKALAKDAQALLATVQKEKLSEQEEKTPLVSKTEAEELERAGCCCTLF